MIKSIITGIGFLIGIDSLLKYYKIEGRYYFNHMVCNSIVVYNTFNSMLLSYDIINITNTIRQEQLVSLYNAKIIIYSLHLYHVLWYYRNLRRDDWIHHVLMIGIVLPLTEIVPQNHIISHGLFFTTGLPGLIDYTLLFFNRNNLIDRYIEKRFNTFLNLWIRAPGCIMNTCMSIMTIVSNYNQLNIQPMNIYGGIVMLSLVYWNGIYFMGQVVTDYANHNHRVSCVV
jgi:hypothetical protein